MQQSGSGRILCSVCFGLIACLAPAAARAQEVAAADPATAPLWVPVESVQQQAVNPTAPAAASTTLDAGVSEETDPGADATATPSQDSGRAPAVDADTENGGQVGAVEQEGIDQQKPKKRKGKRKQRERNTASAGVAGDLVLGDPWGDTKDQLRIAGLAFRFLAQTQYRHTIVEASRNRDETYRVAEDTLALAGDGWSLNRFFFRIVANPSQHLSLRLITDFAEFRHSNSRKAVKQAFVELKPVPEHLHFQVGVLKLPFSTLELDPVAKHEVAFLGEANDLITRLGFAGRDLGAQVTTAPFAKPKYLELAAGVFAGRTKDENRSLVGAVGARLVSRALRNFRLGIGFVGHPNSTTYLNPFDNASKDLLPNPANPNYPRSRTWTSGQAYGADVTFSRAGLMLRGEAMLGTRVDYDTRYGAERWGAVWALAAYRFAAGPVRLQPAIRAELLDTDMEHKAGLRRQLSLALAAWVSKTTRLLLDVTRTDVQQGSPVLNQPDPLREVPYSALDNTRVTTRLQVDL